MNKIYIASLTMCLILSLSACSRIDVDQAVECTLIDKPVFMGNGGVRMTDVRKVGLTYTYWSTEKSCWTMIPIKYPEQFDDITTADNMNVDLDSYVTLQIISGKTPVIDSDWGAAYYVNNIKDVYRQLVRAAIKDVDSQVLRTDTTKSAIIGEEVKEKLQEYITKEQIPVMVRKVVLGKAIPPQAVLTEAAETAAQAQKQKTQLNRKKAADSREAAEIAEAKADNAYRNKLGYSPDQYLEYLKIQNQTLAITSGKNVSFIYSDIPQYGIQGK